MSILNMLNSMTDNEHAMPETTRMWANAQRDGHPAKQVAPSVQRHKV